MKRSNVVAQSLFLILPSSMMAGGLMMYEVGSADVGLASAGYSARAQDPSTVLTNPAGMSELSGTQVLGGAQLLYGDMSFNKGSGTEAALGDNDGGNPVGLFPGASFFVTHQLSPQVTVGFGLAGNFGLAESYDENWVGRYYIQDATLIGLSALPSISYKVNESLSLGTSINIMTGIFDNKVAMNNLNPSEGDGSLRLKDTDVGYGINLGLLYHVDDKTRLGMTYTSKIDLDFSSSTDFSGLGSGLTALLQSKNLYNQTIDMGVHVPQTINLSLVHQLDEKWSVLGSTGWQDWSEFGMVDVGFNGDTLTKDINLRDTWNLALGAQYTPDSDWLVNMGIAYDSGLQDSNHVSPIMPMNAMWRFATGFQNRSNKSFEWGMAAEYQYGETIHVDIDGNSAVIGGRGDLSGSYQPRVLLISANAIWKF